MQEREKMSNQIPNYRFILAYSNDEARHLVRWAKDIYVVDPFDEIQVEAVMGRLSRECSRMSERLGGIIAIERWFPITHAEFIAGVWVSEVDGECPF